MVLPQRIELLPASEFAQMRVIFRGHHDPPEELAAKAVAVFHHQSGFCFRGLANPGENLEHN
jgi:hypothetical protein